MSKMQSIRKVPHNLTLLLVKDPTTAKRERDAQKETVVQTDKITIVAQIELNRKIGTLTQGTTLVTTIATLPKTTPPTTLTTPLPDIDNIPKSVTVIAMIEMFLMSGTPDAIPHTTIMVKIVLRHLMLTPSKEIPPQTEDSMLFPKKPQKKF
jgi:hypothetical protein